MQPTLCSRCKKNVAVVFISKLEGDKTINEGLCLKCAKELGLPQVDDMMKRMGISDEDLDTLNSEMLQAMNGVENIEDLPGGDGDDTEEEEGKTATFPFLNQLFGVSLLVLGIYLPMLVVEPLLTYRFGRVQETVHKAVSKGVRITVGYALLLLVVGVVREWLSLGTVFGAPVGRWALLPLAKMPAGGFIVLGILCAIWRAAAAKRKEYLKKEARDTLTVHYQKEGNREP